MSDIEDRKISGLKVRILRDHCIGTGSCNHVAPEIFVLNYEQKVHFTDTPPDIKRDRLIEACEVCPVDALDIFDENDDSLIS